LSFACLPKIKIYDSSTVYYDNQMGDNAYANATQAILHGQISLH